MKVDSKCSKYPSINYEPLVPWLEGKGRNDYSQFGEDGLIEATLEHVGTTNRQCFEVGAGDGQTLSNTRRLVEDGWKALWVENSALLFMRMLRNVPKGGTVKAVPAPITPRNCNAMLAELPSDIDLGVLDIDGEDYWVWLAMESKPRVMMVEFSPYQADQELLPTQGTDVRDQAPFGPIVRLGQDKGYKLVARTYCNALFVLEDLL